MPVCCRCREDRPASEFYKNAARRGGIQARCKACDLAQQKEPKARERQKQYRTEHSDRIERWRHSESGRAHVAAWFREFRKRPGFYQEKQKREAARLARSPSAKLASLLRGRFRNAVARRWKSGESIRLLGCTVDELRVHIERQFAPGMTWENWSCTGWHIDHIRPFASFDLTDPRQLATACHYTNLRPLWALDNLRKNKRAA